ncbi:hypothetical protein D039_3492B, partial [Vibrio parahaemolyticus EKP-028]
ACFECDEYVGFHSLRYLC